MNTNNVRSAVTRLAKLTAVVAAITLLAAACGNGSVLGNSTEAASVGGAAISRSELDSILVDVAEPGPDGTVDAATTSGFLTKWVFMAALGQELNSQGYEITQGEIDEAATQLDGSVDTSTPYGRVQLDQRATQLAAEPYITAKMADIPVDVVVPEYLCSSHILVSTLDEANVVVQRLADGEDFATLATEVSIGPSGPNGGDLGCVDTTTLIPDFVAGARTVAPSGITAPVKTRFGFHVIKVRSMGPLNAENHPEMGQAAIDDALQQAKAKARSVVRDEVIGSITDAVSARIAKSVKIDPRYGEWVDGVGVVVPSGVTPEG